MSGHYTRLVHSGDVGKVTLAFEDAITASFVTNPMISITKDEINRRFRLCDKIFSALRGDLKWSIPKICDALPTYLKCELDGVPYNPETVGASWSPQAIDGAHDVPRMPANPTVGADLAGTDQDYDDQYFQDLDSDE